VYLLQGTEESGNVSTPQPVYHAALTKPLVDGGEPEEAGVFAGVLVALFLVGSELAGLQLDRLATTLRLPMALWRAVIRASVKVGNASKPSDTIAENNIMCDEGRWEGKTDQQTCR
jgi:hypothetical protein